LIVLALIGGGYFFLSNMTSNNKDKPTSIYTKQISNTPNSPTVTTSKSVTTQNQTDVEVDQELDAIEKELNSLDPNAFDVDF